MSSPKHIAVVGAGIAGLSCATLLQQAGFGPHFDKSRGPPGASTRRGEDWECGSWRRNLSPPATLNFRNEVARWQQAAG
ncbi:MAG: NAD(P)-binding protein [Rhodocyclaceae bacterium]|nr:NAD(P)-binding protein [Rhodocyclaceae bacterium]